MKIEQQSENELPPLFIKKTTIFPVLFVDIYLYLISAMLLAVITVFYHVIVEPMLL